MSDVCLVLEGTFPYVRGGVSSWVYNLVRSLPNIEFSVLLISAERDEARTYKYPIPDNITGIQEIYLHEYRETRRVKKRHRQRWELIERLYDELWDGRLDSFDAFARLFANDPEGSIDWREFFFSKRSWSILERLYKKHETENSFIDYFWTWRFTHLPLYNVFATQVPRARVYHTISTGYAGLLGALAKIRNGAPLILTEHGIYTNERKIEIISSEWIFEESYGRGVRGGGASFFKQWWINLFGFMSRVTYQYSDEIITLYSGNQLLQLEDGAPPAKLSIIPNGISVEAFSGFKCAFPKEPGALYIGFVGRVVPIKDVKTFVKAVKIVKDRLPNVKALILGPTDEDEAYHQECRILTRMLSLDDVITFTGPINVKEYYPGLDVVVLTSVSEAQPLVILEAHTQGVPCVATDVGACSEMLYGRTDEDRALGKSGLVTNLASPQDTADAICTILSNPEMARKMGQAGKKRTELFYNETDLNFKYFDLYRHYMNVVIGR
ncbi:MAG: hypothetical protein A3G34_06960 [Candidatus Lindowbacteria bacterium RIFCSPLOWO2_12_FULL_62_27]|nr:MAG: hypothetical protein A3G34_06960 [Candidatus Lindowbacteria bacterium RIFCSPLOWO2_12_FULL_62_27]OGH61284.1 MAG: hypothetical protein A3I06_03370 [Candidatus Lindowbacteria bacterium RIFCSPLOWO2_02_FULL_62_12]